MTLLKKIILLLCCLTSLYNFGQEKLEREYRIKAKTVPLKAKQFLDSLQIGNNIKWFGEESLQGKSIEAKTRFNKIKYSIEFDTLGNLQDVEIEISKKVIPPKILNSIDQQLRSDFKKYKFVKIQKQITGSNKQVITYLKGNKKAAILIKYEIVLKGIKKRKKYLYEYTFSDKGFTEKRERIVFRNSDNLEY